MANSIAAGFALIIFAAVCGGAFALPIKLRRRFELENLYVIAATITMLILPLIAARAVLPHWRSAIGAVGTGVVWRGLGYGFAWGVGAIAFGYAISLVGLSIGYAVIMGINTAVGSLLPFIVVSSGDLFRTAGLVVLAGIAGCIAGVAICGWAGHLRERTPAMAMSAAAEAGTGDHRERTAQQETGKLALGLAVCLVSGVLSACANLGFAFTSQVGLEAQKLGASPVMSTLASWILVYWGGALAMLVWFGGLQVKKGTWRRNLGAGSRHDLLLACLMGVLWFLAMIPYGMGAYYLGRLGTSVGWAINIAASLIIANLLGFFTGEWSHASHESRRVLWAGLAVLVLAMAILGEGNAIASRQQRANALSQPPRHSAM
jgi:L-rhamnose-H+ transport protein